MSRLDELRDIAGSVGIATRHVDALGVWHEPDEETLSRLIAAFGLPSDPKEAAEALAEEGRAAPFGLPPVHIVAQEDPDPALTVRLPAESGGVEWHCRLEDGTAREGRSDGAALRLPGGLPLGYHRLVLAGAGETPAIGLVLAPDSAPLHHAPQQSAPNPGPHAPLYL